MLLNFIYFTTYDLLGNLPKFRLLNHEIYLNFKFTKFNRKRDLGQPHHHSTCWRLDGFQA